MNLRVAFNRIAQQFGLDADELWQYATEDQIGGWTSTPRYWNPGAIFGVEGQVLYAMVRAIQPDTVYEIGVGEGCSTSHLLAALQRNGKGQLISTDYSIKPRKNFTPGYLIPDNLRMDNHHIFAEDGVSLFKQAGSVIKWPDGERRQLPTPDLFWADGGHSAKDVEQAARLAMEILEPGGFFVCHDTFHPAHIDNVRAGLAVSEMQNVLYLLIDPADTGIGIWRKPDDAAPKVEYETHGTIDIPGDIQAAADLGYFDEPEPEEKPKPKPRRRRRTTSPKAKTRADT